MTVSTTANRVSYTGNGATTAFSFPYPYRIAADLVVIVRTIASGAESVKATPADYTVSGVADSGTGGFSSGTITFGAAPTSAQEVHILRNVTPTQTADYTAGSGINPPTLEGGLDLLSLAAQYSLDGFDRVLRGKRTDAALSEMPNSVSRTNKMLAFDANGQPIVSTGTLAEIEAATLAAPEATVKGRASGSGTGSPVNLTGTQLNAILPNFGGATSSLDGSRGVVPQPLAGDEGKFLKGDGTFAIPTTNVAANSITYDKLQDVSATNRVLGRASAGAGDVEEIVCTAAGRALLDDADAGAQRTTLGLGSMATESSSTYLTVSTASSTYQPLDGDLTSIAALTTAAYGRSLLEATSEANFKANVNLEIGVDVQAYDADLAAIAGLAAPGADRLLFWDHSALTWTHLTLGTNLSISGTTLNATGGGGLSDGDYGDIVVSGGGTVLSIDSGVATTFGRSLMDDADAATARTTLGLVIGTNVQAQDAELSAIAGLVSAADRLPYFTGSGTAALATFTAAGRNLLDDADTTAQRATLGLVIGTNVQAFDAELSALAGLTSAADALPYFTGVGTASTTTLTSFARGLLDDVDATAARSTLGLVIGTNVQAQDAELAAIAGLTSAADRLPYFTGSGTAALATFTTAGRNLVDDADTTAQRATLGLTIGTDVQAFNARLADVAALVDPNADRLVFWDDSAGALVYLTLGTNLSITGTTLNASGGGGGLSDADYGDITVSGTGTVMTIDNDVVTYAKMQNAGANTVLTRAAGTSGDIGETALAASQLLGRGATGDIAAITLGTNLSMSGTTLNATGGGGGLTLGQAVASQTLMALT